MHTPPSPGHTPPGAHDSGPVFPGHGTPAGHAPPTGPPQVPPPAGSHGLLGLRSALILLMGVLVATGAAVLTYLAQHDAATAVLAGGAAFAGAVVFFHSIIAP